MPEGLPPLPPMPRPRSDNVTVTMSRSEFRLILRAVRMLSLFQDFVSTGVNVSDLTQKMELIAVNKKVV